MTVEGEGNHGSPSMVPGGDISEEAESTVNPLMARAVDAAFELSAVRSCKAVITHQGAFPDEPAVPMIKPLSNQQG
ncbi:MAG: hypothetical protein ABSD69_02090 [Candidatus Levyibacteriota bacterium]|jgi:hypothetical protein